MTSGHVLFIPGVLLVGMFLGFIFGARAARNQFDLQQKRQAEREAPAPHVPPRSPPRRTARRLASHVVPTRRRASSMRT